MVTQHRGRLIGIAALVLSLGSLAYFTRPRAADGGRQANRAPVRTGTVSRRNMAVIERSTGSVIAGTFVQVLPLVTGELKRQDFHEGQFVNKGDVLFEIDPAPYEAAVAQARGIYQKDVALLDNALADRKRLDILYKQNAISQQVRDTAVATYRVLTATVASDKAALDTALLNLGHTKIRSPIGGKTGPVLVQPGNIANTSSQTPLVTIAQLRPVKVSFTLQQGDLPRIQAQQRAGKLMARLELPGTAGVSYVAPVDFVSNGVNAQSGTIELRATFKNDDLALVPGELVQVVVELGELQNALVLPRNAVNDSPSGPFVYVIEQDRAVVKPVAVLFDDGANAAVTGELHPSDMVVTEGQLRVDAGGPVQVLGQSTSPPKMASDKIHPVR